MFLTPQFYYCLPLFKIYLTSTKIVLRALHKADKEPKFPLLIPNFLMLRSRFLTPFSANPIWLLRRNKVFLRIYMLLISDEIYHYLRV